MSQKTLCVLIIAIIALGIYGLNISSPSVKVRPPATVSAIGVDILTLTPRPFPVAIRSFGIVQPQIQSQLVAQVTGRVVFISENFRDGGEFKQGEVLLRLEDADYQYDLANAKSAYQDTLSQLAEEEALTAQAQKDWNKLNPDANATALVLRKPQLNAAKARVASAQANVNRAKLSIQRARITAPFDGRVLNKRVDLGQVVPNNAILGEIFSNTAFEIPLPIKLRDIPFLPDEKSAATPSYAEHSGVVVSSSIFPNSQWKGKIVRKSAQIDESSRQWTVVARIDKPYSQKEKPSLRVGEYVTAKIHGKVLNNALIIPNSAIYQGSYVYIHQDGAAYRRDIEYHWQDEEETLIETGLKQGDQVILTTLGQISSGTPVRLIDAKNTPDQTSDHPEGKPNTSVDLNTIPPERLKRLQARAEREGKTVEALIQENRQRRGGLAQ